MENHIRTILFLGNPIIAYFFAFELYLNWDQMVCLQNFDYLFISCKVALKIAKPVNQKWRTFDHANTKKRPSEHLL